MVIAEHKFIALCFLIALFARASGSDTNPGQLTSPADQQDEETAAFKRLEDKMVSFMKNVRKQVFPFLTRAAYEVALTPNCTKSLMRLYNDLLTLKTWALKMLDSSGKIPSGLLKGSMAVLGNYDECLEIEEPSEKPNRDLPILGKYCLTFLYVPSTLLYYLREFSAGRIRNSSSTERFKELFDLMSRYKFDGNIIHSRYGVCIPSTCSEEDLSNIFKYALIDSGVTAEIRKCQVKEHYHFSVEQMVILCLYGVIGGVIIVGTICDCFISAAGQSREKNQSFKDSRSVQMVVKFSIISSIKQLSSEELEVENSFKIPCLRGFSVLLFCFFMVVISYAVVDEHAIRNFSSSMNYFSMLQEPLFAVIANSMILVDVVFGIAGFLLFYSASSQTGFEMSTKTAVAKVIFRYVLPILAAISVFLLLPVFGDGPAFHEVLDNPLSACRKRWWTNILFFNNFLEFQNQCFLHTWFLGCLVQLLIIGFAFKWVIARWSKCGLGSLVLLTLACNTYMGIAVVQEKLPPTLSMYFIFSIQTAKKVTEKMFFLPFAHMGPFAVGMCTGYWLQHQNFRVTRIWKLLGWLVVIILLCCLFFGLYPYHDGTEINHAALALYSSLHGIVLGVTVCLALVISLRSDTDVVRQILCSKYFIPLRNLLYYAFLLHWVVIFFHIAISRDHQYLSHYEQISRSFSHILASFFLAFIFHVFFNGVFSLHEVMPTDSEKLTCENVSCFKHVFRKKQIDLESPHAQGDSGDFAMQSYKEETS